MNHALATHQNTRFFNKSQLLIKPLAHQDSKIFEISLVIPFKSPSPAGPTGSISGNVV
jgi:hypothetical protein